MLALGAVCIIVLTVCLNMDSAEIGFMTDDFVLLDAAVNHPIEFWGGWVPELPFYYRPAVVLSLYWNHLLFGMDPKGYHLTNIAIQASTSAFLFLLLSSLIVTTESRKRAIIAALAASAIFAAYPANAHNVAWIAGRTDLMAALFGVLTMLTEVWYQQTRALVWRILSLVTLVLSLMSKEIAFVVPIALAVIVSQVRLLKSASSGERAGMRVIVGESFRECVFHFAIAAAFLMARVMLFEVSDPRAGFGSTILQEWLLFFGRVGFLFTSPIDTLSLYAAFKGGEAGVIIRAVMPGLLLAIVLGAIVVKGSPSTRRAIGIGFISVIVSLAPFVYLGWIVQRFMTVPFMLAIIVLAPVVYRSITAEPKVVWLRFLGVIALLISLALYTLSYGNVVSDGVRASILEREYVRQIVDQVDDRSAPIAILAFPHRVNLSPILFLPEYRLHYAFYGTFGKCENLETGFQVVGTDMETLGSGLSWESLDSGFTRFRIEIRDETQFLSLQLLSSDLFSGRVRTQGFPGEELENRLLRAKSLRVNDIGRMTSIECTLRLLESGESRQVFTYVDRRMVRIK